MKAPQGTGMVVATADIQNWGEGTQVNGCTPPQTRLYGPTFMMMKRKSVMKTLT